MARQRVFLLSVLCIFCNSAAAQSSPQAAVPTSASNTTAAPAASGSAAAAAAKKLQAAQAYAANDDFYNYLFIIFVSLVVFIGAWRIILESTKYVRTLTCLNNPRQNYFKKPNAFFGRLKSTLLYAPISRKRHNREIQLSSAINIGTLPTRFQFLFLLGYLGTNVAFCVVSIHWNSDFITAGKELRNRAGMLATVNMIPLFIMAGRNNPLINWIGLSFDTFNLLHRWFGRIVALEAVVHVAAWIATTYKTAGWVAVSGALSKSLFLQMGLVDFLTNTQAVCAFVAISIQAASVFRHAFYETFKMIHKVLVIVVIIGLWYHLQLGNLPQIQLVYGVVSIWVVEHFTRIGRTVFRNVGAGGSKALIEALPGNACRVTLDMARPWTFKPGQHAYLYMPSIAIWQAHPFSVAWSSEGMTSELDKESGEIKGDILAPHKASMAFIIRARTGFTHALYKKAAAAPNGRMWTRCFAEGPYGGLHKMHSYGTVVLFAGGVGITHQVPHVRDLVAGYANGTVAARRILLVWIIQSPEHLEWIRPWMTDILAMEGRRDVLRIMLFISRPRSTKEIHSPSATVQMFPGRPNIEMLLDGEVESQVGAMGVSVCGSGALSDDVRSACRKRQQGSNLDFVEEAFSW